MNQKRKTLAVLAAICLLFPFTSCGADQPPAASVPPISAPPIASTSAPESQLPSVPEPAPPAPSQAPAQSSSAPFDPYSIDVAFLKENNIPPGYFYYPGYDLISYPIEGKILARKGTKWGFLEEKTYQECIPFVYGLANDFHGGYAAVCQDGKWGYIDASNQVILPFQFARAFSVNKGVAVVYTQYLDVWETDIHQRDCDYALEQFAYYDIKSGKLLYQCPYLFQTIQGGPYAYPKEVAGQLLLVVADENLPTQKLDINGYVGMFYDENGGRLTASSPGIYEDEPIYEVALLEKRNIHYVSLDELRSTHQPQ